MLFSGVGERLRPHKDVCLAVGLFVLAVVPRVVQLDVFLTPDEPVWIEGAVHFFQALLSRDYAHAYYLGSPGITTMWVAGLGLIAKYLTQLWAQSGGEAASLWAFLQSVPLYPIDVDFLFALRLPVALIASCTVVGAYLLIKELFDRQVAVLSAIIIALDPFYMAHSRLILLDALVTSFMLLSVLGFITYLKHRRSLGYTIFSGVAAGLAFLTKSPSLFLAPFMLFLVLATNLLPISGSMRTFPRQVYRGFLILGIWAVTALLIYFLLWPAMWVDPIGMVSKTIGTATTFAKATKLRGNFLFGETELDPGPLYYLVQLLFRMTPLTLLGTAASLALLVGLAGKEEKRPDILLLLSYVLLYTTFITMGSTKEDRYLLPIFPVVDILAAMGWYSILRRGVRRMRRAVGKRWVSRGGVAALLIWQIGVSLPHYPYYLTAYNPMVGGGYLAPQVLLVGWGEGLEQAARYLNERSEERPIRVASWYSGNCLAPFFRGRSQEIPLLERDLPRLDYAVFYINQMQRKRRNGKPFQYFQGWEPEYTVRLKGIEYAWVYPVPKPTIVQNPQVEYQAGVNFDGKLLLLGYNVEEVIQKKEPSWLEKYLKGYTELLSEHRTFFHITYFWRCLEEIEKDYTLATQFEGHHDKIYRIDQSHQGGNGAYPTSMWQVGEVIREEYQVEVPADYPPIRYALWVGVRDGEERLRVVNDVEVDGEDRVRLGEIEVLPAERPTPLAAEPRPQNSVEVNINDELMFLGYDLNERHPQPGDQLRVTTYWQSMRKTERDYAIQVELRNGGYKVREILDIAPIRLWEEGRYYRGEAVIAINPHLLGGMYSLNLGLEKDDGTEAQVSLASLDIPCPRRHIIRRLGKANYRGREIISLDEPLSLRFHLKESEALELVAGWTGKAGGEETRVEVYITNAYWRDKYLGTWVVESGDYRVTKRKIGKVFAVPGENVIELKVPEVRERVHNIGWRGVVDRVFPDLLQDPRTDYDGPIQMDFVQMSTRWEGDWDDYYDLAQVYAERGMQGEVARLYEEAMDQGVVPGRVDEFALFKRAYRALGEERKVGGIEKRIAERIAHKMNVNLGGKAEFLGHSLRGEEGDGHELSLFFRCLEEMEEDYTLWVHGEVEDESLLEGHKGEAGYAVFDHLLSTSRWQVGEVYQDDEVRGLRPGRYHFTLGLWRPEDGSRLWWEDDPNAHIIDLGWIEMR